MVNHADLAKKLANFYLSLDKEGQRTFLTGAREMNSWFNSNHYMGLKGKGELVRSSAVDMTVLIQFVYWLSGFFPDSKKGVSKVFRLQGYSENDKITEGKKVTVTPWKPITSWTTNDSPVVKGRSRKGVKVDVIMSTLVKEKNIVWSYKANSDLLKVSKLMSKIAGCKDAGFYLELAVPRVKVENEIVVYHGLKPFKATVEEVKQLV